MIYSDALQSRLNAFVAYLRARIRDGKPFEGTFKFSPQQVEVGKKFVYRVTLDNPMEKDVSDNHPPNS